MSRPIGEGTGIISVICNSYNIHSFNTVLFKLYDVILKLSENDFCENLINFRVKNY